MQSTSRLIELAKNKERIHLKWSKIFDAQLESLKEVVMQGSHTAQSNDENALTKLADPESEESTPNP